MTKQNEMPEVAYLILAPESERGAHVLGYWDDNAEDGKKYIDADKHEELQALCEEMEKVLTLYSNDKCGLPCAADYALEKYKKFKVKGTPPKQTEE